jgi:hypothetical protein
MSKLFIFPNVRTWYYIYFAILDFVVWGLALEGMETRRARKGLVCSSEGEEKLRICVMQHIHGYGGKGRTM